jgi:hypothetical protein
MIIIGKFQHRSGKIVTRTELTSVHCHNDLPEVNDLFLEKRKSVARPNPNHFNSIAKFGVGERLATVSFSRSMIVSSGSTIVVDDFPTLIWFKSKLAYHEPS